MTAEGVRTPMTGGTGAKPALRLLVTGSLAVGAVGAVAVLALPSRPLVDTGAPVALAVAVLVVLAALSEVAYVRVPHGESTEDLTFFEAVVVAAALVLPPALVLSASLAGLAAACIVLRRPLVKTAFNMGTYAAGTSALLLAGHTCAALRGVGAEAALDAYVVFGLMVGTVAFALVNLVALAAVLAVVEAAPPAQWLREEWATSAVMVIGSVGIGTVGVQLALANPILLPFTGLPVLALMRSYRASQDHARARERANALVELNTYLTAHQPPDALVAALEVPLCRLFAVDTARVVMPEEHWVAPVGAVPVPLDLGDEQATLYLGAASDARRPVDLPMLGAVASAIASVLRAGRHLSALVEESSKLQAVIDHATDGIAVLDSEGGVLVWSPSMRELIGDPPTWPEPTADDDLVVTLLAAMSTAPAVTTPVLAKALPAHLVRAKTQVTVSGRHGDEREVDVSVARIRRSGEAWRLAVLTLRDATQERRLEKMKSDFVATVSHELKTPITPIKGYARLLASRGDRMEPARRLHALQLIEDRADHLSRLVDDLLLASRAGAGPAKLQVDLGDADMRNVVRQATDAFPLLTERLEVHLPARSVPVVCDVVRALQCVSNLIGNAEKYSAPGTPIRVELVDDVVGGWASVLVTDRGRGIAPADLDRIFERFSRIEDPFTMQTSGSGLGLYIARELSRAMRGDILVSSEPGIGSTFTFRLPAHGRRTDGAPASSSVSSMAG